MVHSRSGLGLFLGCSFVLAASSTAQETEDGDGSKNGDGAEHGVPAKTPTIEERLTALEQRSSGGEEMRVHWKDGLRFESGDKKYKVRLGGRIHYDGQFFDPDDETRAAVENGATRIEDGTELRRVWLELNGEVAERTYWSISADFAGNSSIVRNAYVGLRGLPFGSVRAGHFKEPYGLEQLTTSNTGPFTERSLMNSLVPGYNAGVMVYDAFANERATWAVGVFRNGSGFGEVVKGDGDWSATGRLTGLPHHSAGGKSYVHVGAALSHRSPLGDTQGFSAKPEANLAPTYVEATLAAEAVDLIGGELAFVRGPFHLSGEYTLARVEGDTGTTSDPDFAGYYVQAGWFLTGETRPYKKAHACFDLVKPNWNFMGRGWGLGAWELAARMSSLDLDDEETDGGTLDDLTFGVNWYLNPNTRVMFDYILADLAPGGGGDEGETKILAFRVQFNY